MGPPATPENMRKTMVYGSLGSLRGIEKWLGGHTLSLSQLTIHNSLSRKRHGLRAPRSSSTLLLSAPRTCAPRGRCAGGCHPGGGCRCCPPRRRNWPRVPRALPRRSSWCAARPPQPPAPPAPPPRRLLPQWMLHCYLLRCRGCGCCCGCCCRHCRRAASSLPPWTPASCRHRYRTAPRRGSSPAAARRPAPPPPPPHGMHTHIRRHARAR